MQTRSCRCRYIKWFQVISNASKALRMQNATFQIFSGEHAPYPPPPPPLHLANIVHITHISCEILDPPTKLPVFFKPMHGNMTRLLTLKRAHLSGNLLTPEWSSFSVAYPSFGPWSFETELEEPSSSTSYSPYFDTLSTVLKETRMPKCESHPTAFELDVKSSPASCNFPVATPDTHHERPRGYPASSKTHHPPPSPLDNAACSFSNAYKPTSSAAYGAIPSPSEVQLYSWCQLADTESTASNSETYNTTTASYKADSPSESYLSSSVTCGRKKMQIKKSFLSDTHNLTLAT